MKSTASKSQHDPYEALRYQGFLFLQGGSFFSILGHRMVKVAIGWELYERFGLYMVLAWVGMAQALPVILFCLHAGHAADRYNRRNILLGSQLVLALVGLGLMLLSWQQGPLWMIYACLALYGVAVSYNTPASSALVPQLLPRKALSNAAAWGSTAFEVAAVLGPVLAGFLIHRMHSATLTYGLSMAADLLFFLSLLFVDGTQKAKPAGSADIHTLLQGVRFVWKDKIILSAITLDLFAVLLGGAEALLPVYAKDILRVGPMGLGWLQAATYLGAFSMALSLAHLPPMKQAGRALLWAVLGFGLCMICFGLSKWFWLSFTALLVSGALDNISVVVRHVLVQVRTPDAMLGRVSAVNNVFIRSSNQLGEFESGATAALFGPVLSVAGGGVGTVLVVLAVARIWPEITKLGNLHQVKSN